MSFMSNNRKYNGPLEAAHAHTNETTIDTTWLNVMLLAGPNWTSQISYNVVASLPTK